MSSAGTLFKRVLPFVVSVGALAWLLRSMDVQALADALSWRALAVGVPALVAYGAITLLIEALSITRLAENAPDDFGNWTAARIKCASYLLAIVHYMLGAGALAVLLRRRAGLSLAGAASLVLLISSADLVVLLVVAAGAAASLESNAPTVRGGLLVLGVAGFFGGLALLRAPFSLGPLERLRSLAIFEGLRTVPLSRLTELLALRAGFVVTFVGLSAAAFAAFELRPPLALLIAGSLVVALVAAIPIAVGGLGTSQVAFVYVFQSLADPEMLLAVSLALSAGMLSLRGLMGLVFAREFTREALRATRSAES